MSKYLYEVRLKNGRSNPNHSLFYINVTNLSAIACDHGGINNICLISHHLNAETIQELCSDGLVDTSDVTVEEITNKSLCDEAGHHKLHIDKVNNYFLPYNKYPNITEANK